MEPLELSPALLQPQDSAVAILGQLLATLPRENETLLGSAASLSRDMEEFTRELRATLYRTDDNWRYWNVTNDCINPLTFLSQALAAYDSTLRTPQEHGQWRFSTWETSPRRLMERWAELAKKATELRNTCTEVAAETARYEALVRIQAGVAASEATRATMERQRLEAALGLLERLGAACDGATAFPWKLSCLLWEMEDTLVGRKEASSIVPEALVAKAAVAERLWEASTRRAVAHLVRTFPDTIKLWFTGAPTCPSACGVAERCQRATEDIPRLLQPPERPQGVPRVSPVSTEFQEPQVTVVATLGELLATLPRRDEEMLLPESAVSLYWDLEEFTRNLRVTLYCTEGTWWRCNVTSDDGVPVPSLSRALDACRSTPGTTWDDVTMAARKWHRSVSALVDRWAKLASKATELRNTCRNLATKAADREGTNTARARELQAEAARDGTAQEHMGELGQALGREEGAEVVAGREAWESREAGVAASEATRATMERQRLEAALGLLERLVAACDEATAFPRELQWRLRDTENALKGTNEASPDVPEDLVAMVAEAERLWEANARLAKDHLLGTLGDIIGFYFNGDPTRPSARGVAERCQRATEDIPRLLQVPECPQSVPKICPVSLEPQELSPALLQPQVTVVATLGELLATLPRRGEMKLVSAVELYWDLVTFTKELRVTLYCTEGTWWRRNVTSDGGDPVPSLSRALAACRSTPGTTWDCVTMAASEWQGLVAVLVNSWARLARAATKLRNSGIEAAAEALDRAALARERQRRAEIFVTPQENMGELGQALGGEEGAEEEDSYNVQRRTEAWVAASEATRATMVRQRLEAALGLLERLVAACDGATAFPRKLKRRVGDIEVTMEGTNEASPDVPEALVAKVAEAERLWEASARLARDHLLGAVPDASKLWFTGGPTSPSACGVAERCQRAIEDIPRLLRTPECPQSVPRVSPVSLELQELSPALLQPQVTAVATLGELLATLPRRDNEMMMLLKSPWCLYSELLDFTAVFDCTPYGIDEAWFRRKGTSRVEPPTSLSRALAAYRSTPWTTWFHVRLAARKWQEAVDWRVRIWADQARAATELRDACRAMVTEVTHKVATNTAWARELQAEAAHDGTAQEHMGELGQALGSEEGAEVVAGREAQVRREARVAASLATTASRRRQRLEAALGLLERLVAACDEATAFTRELQRRVGDIKAALKGTNEASPDIPEALVAKVSVAERLWEASTRLAKDHLEGTRHYICKVYIYDEPVSLSGRGVAERCQSATEDIPRLLRPRERPQGVPKVAPLSPALLQPQVTVVATLGELLATLPRVDEERLAFMSPGSLYWVLEEFTNELRVTLYRIDDSWWHHSVTSNDDDPRTSHDGDPVTSLSQALAAWESTPGITWGHVTMAASKWHRSVAVLVNSWAQLARKATELRNTCRNLATEAAELEAIHIGGVRDLLELDAVVRKAQENMGELGRALGREEGDYEAQERREVRMAASEAIRATMERQQVEEALGLLERLAAACDGATAFPRELQLRAGDIEAALKGTNEESPDIPADLVAKVAEVEQLWEANARLAKDHLLGTLGDIIGFYFNGDPTRPSARGVAERCQRATEDIPRLLQVPECPQSVPKISPVSLEPQELSPALLQPQVTVVATLGELLATLPRRDEEMLPVSTVSLYWDLVTFTESLRVTLYCTEGTWWHRNVTSDDGDPVPSLSQALPAWESTPWTTWGHVTMAARKWHRSVSALVNSWAQLARAATKLRNTCRDLATEAADREGTNTARARELQAEAARDGTAQEHMGELGQALGREEGAEVVAGHEAQVRREARVAAREATRATMERQRLEAALGLLERLVAACDGATAFPRELQRRVGDIEAALKGTNEGFFDIPEDLAAKVAVAERLWEANACLAKDHLLGTLGDIHDLLLSPYDGYGGPDGPGSCAVGERCQKAIEAIPRLLQDSDVTAATSSRQ
ncbi:uncharacterized protein LOC129134394 [Agelaius phoeniceus]|uniref:uncharacterized protein LOC129134394 n=1 Tax=Agelaius phoeniceus TaxID=39638 RepID=UPI0040552E96